MKVTLATVGRFHIFPLARELQRQGCLEAVYSGFPWSRLADEGVLRENVRTFPWVRPILMGARHLPFDLPEPLADAIHELSVHTLDRHVASTMPKSDIYVGHEAVGLISGAIAQKRGALYVCDRGCTHMAWRERVLNEEHERLGLKPRRRPNTYYREIAEYQQADLIVVPSKSAAASFIAEGVPCNKLAVVPYGVNLHRFSPVAQPAADRFDVTFVGSITARKGIADLLAGFRIAAIPGKHLTLVGMLDPAIKKRFTSELAANDITLRGHVPQAELKEILSRSHVFCLPSIEDGFGMAISEAMACACPALVTSSAGGADTVVEGVNGFVIPPRCPAAIAEKLELLASQPDRLAAMRQAALASVQRLGGWERYGLTMIDAYRRLLLKTKRHL